MILVTGATGRIGRHLALELIKRDKDVRILVQNKKNLVERGVIPENLEIVEGDITNIDSLRSAVDGVDTIFHLAGIVDYTAPKDLMYKVNVEGTKNLLEVSRGKKFIMMSSTSVNGNKLQKLPADETAPYNPSDFYGQTKMEAEVLALEHGAIVVRGTDVYGPGFHEGYFQIIKMIKEGKCIIIGNGQNKLQYLHVKDLINCLITVSEKGRNGEVYLVAGSEALTQEELYQMIARNLKVEPPKKHMPVFLVKLIASFMGFRAKTSGKKPKLLPAYVDKLSADRTFDLSKLAKELDFEPKVRYEQGIREVVKEFLATQ